MKPRTPLAAVVVALFALTASAQQQEPNSPLGSLLVNGMNPTPGSPFELGPGMPMTFTVGGAPNAPYALFVGQLAATSIFLPPVASQYFDLDPVSVLLLGDGISGGGALPPFLFLLDPAGQSTWSFPVSPGAIGLNLAVQAAVQDMTLPPFNLNLTAAAEFAIVSRLNLTGQSVGNYVFPSGPYPFYSGVYTSIDVSTSGWIRFGGGATNNDPFPHRANFLAGLVGGATAGAPIVAPMWGPYQFTGAGAEVVVEEIAPGMTRIDWKNGFDFFTGQAMGSIACTIDVTQGAPVVTIDYSMFVNPIPSAIPFVQGHISGITDGGVFFATATEHDLVMNGVVNAFNPPGPVSLFQEFGFGTPIGENVDLAGPVLTYLDANAGSFLLF